MVKRKFNNKKSLHKKPDMNFNFLIPALAIFISITAMITVVEGTEDISDLINKGFDAENATQYEQALSYFDRVLQIEPDNLQALNAKGVIFSKLGHYDNASSYFDRILEIEPDNVEVLNNKIALLVDLRKPEEAIQYLDRILKIEPDNVEVLNNKIALLVDLRKLEEAIQYLDRILEIEPDNVEDLYLKGLVHLKMSEYQQALSYFDRVLQIEPENLDALHLTGVTFQELQEYDKALSYFDRILEIEPDNVDALFGKGGVLGELGNIDEAYYNFVKVQLLDPNHAGAEINMRIALNDLSYDSFEGSVKIQFRNSEGKLLGYQSRPQIQALDLRVTDEYLDEWDVKEIIKREGKDFEVLQLLGLKEIERETSYAESFLHPPGHKNIFIFHSYHHGFPAIVGDTVTMLWTVIRPLS